MSPDREIFPECWAATLRAASSHSWLLCRTGAMQRKPSFNATPAKARSMVPFRMNTSALGCGYPGFYCFIFGNLAKALGNLLPLANCTIGPDHPHLRLRDCTKTKMNPACLTACMAAAEEILPTLKTFALPDLDPCSDCVRVGRVLCQLHLRPMPGLLSRVSPYLAQRVAVNNH